MLNQSAVKDYGSMSFLSVETNDNVSGEITIQLDTGIQTLQQSATLSSSSLSNVHSSSSYADSQNGEETSLAFMTLYCTDAANKRTCLSNIQMFARVIEVEKSSVFSHPFNPNLYVIEVTHGEFCWKIKKRYHHFHKLYAELLFHRALKAGERKTKDPGHLSFARANIMQNTNERKQAVETYLQKILDKKDYYSCRWLQEFFEISRVSFIKELGTKRREGMLLKRSGGHVSPHLAKCCCLPQCCCYVWRKRWFVVRDSFIAYLHPNTQEIKGVLLLDVNFSIKSAPGIARGLLISNCARDLMVFCWTPRRQREWMSEVVQTMGDTGSDWIKGHANQSYAPQRKNVPAKWFVDGEDYFYAVAKALEEAKEEIYITDWWFSPELHMVRPATEGNYWTLDNILKRKAEAGVMIYVLLYKEMEVALTIQSIHSKNVLLELHPTNIKVLRHPDHTPGKTGIFYWAHHEKIVCIDQKVVFLGGLDLCYGRWDNHKHYLTDFGSAYLPMKHSKTEMEIANIGHLFLPAIYLNSDTTTTATDGGETSSSVEDGKISRPRKMLGRARLWFGKDYSNPIKKDFERLDKPYQDNVDRGSTNRMPWHDVAVCIWGCVARDVARHFIQRWNFTKLEKKKEDPFFPLLLPKTYTGLQDAAPAGVETTSINCQVIRSVGKWSAGVPYETSIYNAYIDLIKKSKHYIYIENQFFITSLPPDVKNIVGEALAERITSAHSNGENFKVFIVMPLLPAFEGEIGEASGHSICVISHWNYMSLCRGEFSLIERLQENGVKNPFDYLSICSLRKYEVSRKPITELIYVHSKVMIVDDLYAIIGSANINDRSLLGKRDSEIALLVEDREFISSKMDGNDYKAGVFAHSLRLRLMNEHLGLLDLDDRPTTLPLLNDPISDDFYKDVWTTIAETNTKIYEEVFHCLPSDQVEKFEDLLKYKNLRKMALEDLERTTQCPRSSGEATFEFSTIFRSETAQWFKRSTGSFKGFYIIYFSKRRGNRYTALDPFTLYRIEIVRKRHSKAKKKNIKVVWR